MRYTYFIKDRAIFVKVPYENREKAKAIPGYFWSKEHKMWEWPIFPQDYETVTKINSAFGFNIQYSEVMGDEKKITTTVGSTPSHNEVGAGVDIYQTPVKPFQHQIDVVNMMLKHKKFGLFMDMGTGKTKCVIDWFGVLKASKEVEIMLVVCPKSVISSWIDELIKHKYKEDQDFVVLEGTRKQRLKLMSKAIIINIINYEGLVSLKDEIKVFNQPEIAIVLDESSKIKNPRAKRTKLIVKTFVDNKYKFALSGTPITQCPVDIYPQFKFLDSDYLGFSSYYTFRNFYCVMGGYLNYQIVGYNHLDELKDKINKHSIILKKKDCLDLPDKIYEKRTLDMSTQMAEQYRHMKKELLLELEGQDNITASIILVKFMRLQQILSGRWLDNTRDNVKLNELTDVIKENSDGIKVIIWCRFIESISIIRKRLDIHNISNVVFCGQKSKTDDILYGENGKKLSVIKQRQEIIRKFQEDDVKVFIGQIQTGGMGITLTAASIVIYYENNFSLQDRLQSEDRCHRPGQKNNVTYIDMLYKGTIDEHIMKAITSKEKLSDYLVGGVKDILR